MTAGRWRSARWLGALLGALTISCGPETLAVVTGLEIVVAEGDGQFGTVGQVLPTPLRAVVRATATQEAQEGFGVRWEVEQGSAVLVGSTTTTTDEAGTVEVRVRSGSVPEDVTVRATIVEQPAASITFALHTVEPPDLGSVTPTAAAPGDTVTLTGLNFSPVPGQNVVLFSGIRGRVLTASGTTLTVVVPSCLPARAVAVSVQLGIIASGTVPLTVTAGGDVTSLSVGDPLDVADDDGFACYQIPGGAGVEYLAVVYSASTIGAATHPFELTALSSSSPVTAPARAPAAAAPLTRAGPGDAQVAWHERIRTLEGELITSARSDGRIAPRPGPAAVGPAAVPEVGERRTFNVLNRDQEFDQITAVARYVGDESAIFVDEVAPVGGFTTADLEAFAARFDDVIHPVVTAVYGSESDVDGNDRVIILFTSAVNRLTARGSSGFVGGYFWGGDLLAESEDSNGAEVFFSLVPDPAGIHSDPRTKEEVLSVVPAVLAHEFQHMVQFNQRYLLLDAGQAATWLSEGLAQMAEELVARRYEEVGDDASAVLFRGGTRVRSRRYLEGPDTVSLIFSDALGSLAEYGGAFLHVLYLADQEGDELLGRLTSTTRKGVLNVEAQVGRDWPEIIVDFWSAAYLDQPGPETGPRAYPTVDLRGFLGAPFPLTPEPLGPGSATESGTLWSSSAAYYIVSPDPAGSMTLRLGGEAGGSSSPQAALRLRIIRLS